MEYKIEKQYYFDNEVKVKYWVVELLYTISETVTFFELLYPISKRNSRHFLEPFDTYEEAEKYIYELLKKEQNYE